MKLILYLFLILFAVVEFAAAGFMFAKHRRQPDRSRLFIAIFFLLSALSAVWIFAERITGHEYVGGTIMDMDYVILGFVVYFLLLLYPIEVLRPHWMTWRRSLKLLSPWAFLVLCLVAVNIFKPLELYSASEILPNIGSTDVFLRVLLSLIFIPYGLWTCFMQYNWKESSAPRQQLRGIVGLSMIMTVTFSCTCIFDARWLEYVHIFLYLLLTYSILRLELVVRFRVPKSAVQETETAEDAGDKVALVDETEDDTPVQSPLNSQTAEVGEKQAGVGPVSSVIARLEVIIRETDVWQNPDMSVGELCNLVGTNANYLQKAIKEMGWQSYSDMINRKRIDYVCQELSTGEVKNIQDVFYRAGYRSRVTAWRNFTAITGVSPVEWVSEGKASGTEALS